MVNLTASVKATITESSLSFSPSRCLPGSGNFPLLFAQQFLLNLDRFPLVCGDTQNPSISPRGRRKGGYPRREVPGVRETSLPARDPAFSEAVGGGVGGKGRGAGGLRFPRWWALGGRLETCPAAGGAGGAAGIYSPLHPLWEKSREKSGQNAMDVAANCRDSSKAKVHVITA